MFEIEDYWPRTYYQRRRWKLLMQRFREARWPNGNPRCPFCGWLQHYTYKDELTYKCKNRSCQRNYNLRHGTILQNSKLEIYYWAKAIEMACRAEGVSVSQLTQKLRVERRTAWLLLKKLNSAVAVQSYIISHKPLRIKADPKKVVCDLFRIRNTTF